MVERFNPRARKQRDFQETPFKIILDEQSVAWNRKRTEERGDKPRSLYASDYGQCMRKCWYQFFPKEYPIEDFDPRVLRIFHNGEDVHERLSEYFHQSELVFIEEEDVPRDELDVHGRCDGIAMHKKRFHVLEFKSINRKVVYSAKEEHMGQITWYMAMWEMLRRELREEFELIDEVSLEEEELRKRVADSGRSWDDLSTVERMLLISQGPVKGEIIYESKQTQDLYHFPMELDENLVKKVKEWFSLLKWHVDGHEMPMVRYDRTKFPCSWSGSQCAYYDYCYGPKN